MSDKTVISDALKDAHDHLKDAIEEMKSIGNEPSMSIYKAMHALTYALREANERVHYAEGTAALAMKLRDEAEAKLATSQELCTKFEAAVGDDVGEILHLQSQLAEARKVLEQIATARRLSREDMQRIAGDTVRAIPVTGDESKK